MKPCRIEWIDERSVKFSGVFDEYTSFMETVKKFPDEVWLDFKEVKRVNSLGVKEWIKAISTTKSRLHYINCPAIIVDQFNMIPEFLGQNATIDSFEVYFVCDQCGHEDSRFFDVEEGKQLDPKQENYEDLLETKCLRCGSMMELDHDPEIYFNFIRDMEKAVG